MNQAVGGSNPSGRAIIQTVTSASKEAFPNRITFHVLFFTGSMTTGLRRYTRCVIAVSE
jgi:hypothetical protein